MKLISVTRKKRQAGLLRSAAVCLLFGLTAAVLASGGAAQTPPPDSCNGEIHLQHQKFGGPKGDTNSQPDLKIDKSCFIDLAGTYVYGNVNIIAGGVLEFKEPPGTKGSQVNFWAKNIIVENGGKLTAGTATKPYGSQAGVLTIYLYGKDQSNGLDPNKDENQGQGVLCQTAMTDDGVGPCGIPTKKAGGNDVDGAWSNNGATKVQIFGYPDYFYQYGPLPGDMRCTNPAIKDDTARVLWKNGACATAGYQPGYFGYKVLGVSYGGTLQLFGYKGTPLPKAPATTRGTQFFGGQGTFNSFGTMGAPSQYASQGAPGTSGTFKGASAGGFFLNWIHNHFGNGGGGNGGGGHCSPSPGSVSTASCGGGGGGGGGGLGGEEGTCASNLKVGTRTVAPDEVPTSTGCSWLRLAADLQENGTTLTLSNATDDRWWSADDSKNNTPDEVVVTTTDYLPGHSEKLIVSNIDKNGTVTFTNPLNSKGITWPHRGTRFPIDSRLDKNKQRFLDAGMDPDLINNGAETRAAVALLTRSIRIVSGGDGPGDDFEKTDSLVATGNPDAAARAKCQSVGDQIPNSPPFTRPVPTFTCYSFGAHVVFRQGFQAVQIQGVEFAKLGQPGKMGHYPIHFHMARQVPPDTFIKDSTINESMTRWIVLHSTQGVLLQRNVGYKSIGHGFYLESGTEADNKFYSNLGIFARAAVDNPQNPRRLPGILAYSGQFFKSFTDDKGTHTPEVPATAFPWRSDYMFPTVFWITNGWNDFIGNMAAGAGACGASYWLVPAWNTDMPDVKKSGNTEFGSHMKWKGFASLQWSLALAGSTPLKSFYGNFATSTMTSFQTVGQTSPCPGATWPKDPAAGNPGIFPGITSFAPTPEAPANTEMDMYYPHVSGGGRMATMCPFKDNAYDCSTFTSGHTSSCNNGADVLIYCAVTVLDHFTSSFHWAQTNFAAIWLRPQWYLVDNSVLTDVQNGGLSFITSGTYDRSAVVEGDWAVVRTSVFIGNTQKEGTNSYASNLTPFQHTFKDKDGLPCQNGRQPSLMCANANEGVSLPIDNFAVGQRLFNIYDGPAYQELNIYLDISTAPCNNLECVYGRMPGVRKPTTSVGNDSCYLPNAAIGWKQPNGFFYPPSFHSTNLFFDKVEIRHYVIDALFKRGSYLDDLEQIKKDYCDFSGTFPNFGNFSDIDRQTELNDDDGSLTGLTNDATFLDDNKKVTSGPTGTISVNPVEFFRAPVETAECLSNRGVTPSLACPVNKVLPATPTPAGANTSPYDYVTTVVFPELCKGAFPAAGVARKCGDDNDTVGGVKEYTDKGVVTKFTQYTKLLGRAGNWSAECTNPACYGVPLYRQFLTGTGASRELKDWNATCGTIQLRTANQKDCRWPFVRMGGQSTYQRSSLTVNHGTYFIDTSVSKAMQSSGEAFTTVVPCSSTPVATDKDCSPRSVNVFLGGQTYDVFFLFAKPATKQTYQIYVGSGFNPVTDVKAIRPVLDTMPMPSIDPADWPTNWKKNYNDNVACANFKPATTSCGILQVTVDFSTQTDLNPKSQCKPVSFCATSGSTCGCSLKASDPLALADPVRMDASGKNELFGGILGACQKTCSQWAVKDLDFPGKGPLGFSFKMPANFAPDDQGYLHRPEPQPFPTTRDRDPQKFADPDWLTMFATTAVQPDKSTGACFYSKIPTNGNSNCQIP